MHPFMSDCWKRTNMTNVCKRRTSSFIRVNLRTAYAKKPCFSKHPSLTLMAVYVWKLILETASQPFLSGFWRSWEVRHFETLKNWKEFGFKPDGPHSGFKRLENHCSYPFTNVWAATNNIITIYFQAKSETFDITADFNLSWGHAKHV